MAGIATSPEGDQKSIKVVTATNPRALESVTALLGVMK
jgi:hypothetical protein